MVSVRFAGLAAVVPSVVPVYPSPTIVFEPLFLAYVVEVPVPKLAHVPTMLLTFGSTVEEIEKTPLLA